MDALLKVADMRRQFVGVTAVDGIDLSRLPGAAVAELGPNGTGKLMLLKLVAGRPVNRRGHDPGRRATDRCARHRDRRRPRPLACRVRTSTAAFDLRYVLFNATTLLSVWHYTSRSNNGHRQL